MLLQLRGVAYLREAHINSVNTVALSLSTAAFLLISVSCYGVFGGKGIEADVLRNFTVDALEPLVWTEVAQAGEQPLPGCLHGLWVWIPRPCKLALTCWCTGGDRDGAPW